MACNAGPALAFVSAHPELALAVAHIDRYGIAGIGRHALALHRPPGLRFRQARIETLPGLAAVARNVSCRLARGAGARPDLRAVHGEYPRNVLVSRMQHEREA